MKTKKYIDTNLELRFSVKSSKIMYRRYRVQFRRITKPFSYHSTDDITYDPRTNNQFKFYSY